MCLEVFKHQEKVYGWWFSKLNYIIIGTKDSVSGYKTLNKVLLLYLEVKLQEKDSG